ncbi:nuclear transport factor 2 family protein [Planococcus sp. N028]|uniref:Nuclear transport factor 2 family protein n=1 Tax=Planococcus shixiaomingii TaxID=3058393 RepID=A0ABT8MYS8_9BACL|nr:nuclear transport factor 2 family protein [Planococcus sp. N028]MDN7240795.1 nuclear transport factor 2 family protein [Planococcus sp. N028]
MAIMKTRDFFEQVNQAFLDNDTSFIKENVTEDVVWTMAGEGVIRGKTAFVEFMEKMGMGDDRDGTLTIDNIITEGPQTAVIGKMTGTMEGVMKTYLYCDIYLLDEQQNGKIKELTSFVTEMKE